MSGPEDDHKPRRSGKVRHDAGGRAVWEWAIESGRQALDSTSRLLKKLDLTSLRLVGDDVKSWEKRDTDAPLRPDETQDKPGPAPTFDTLKVNDPVESPRKGFNPYDSRTPAVRSTARPPGPVAPPKPRITQPVRPVKRRGFLSRLFRRDKT